MTPTTTRNLAREVAEALVSIGKLKRETMQEEYYNNLIDHGILVNFSRDIWITILDGDEVLSEMHPDYSNDLNACARDLTREGYVAHLMKVIDGWRTWYTPVYTDGQLTVYGNRIDETEREGINPAVAWCESFLALSRAGLDGEGG